jgi:phosphate transport system ATP-binding protein
MAPSVTTSSRIFILIFTTEVSASDRRTGVLVEYDRTERIFTNPADNRTENYVTGRFG